MDEQTAQSSAMQQYYTDARDATRQLVAAYQKLVNLQMQWNSLDYGNTLEDGEGVHLGLTSTQVGSVIFDTANAVTGLVNAGHGTNLSRLL